jgi:hypothetical protein
MSEFERIRRACVKRSELWEDPDFPATQSSVFYHQTPPFQFVWKRPHVSTSFLFLKTENIILFYHFEVWLGKKLWM